MSPLDQYLTTSEAAILGGFKSHRSIVQAIRRGNLKADMKGKGYMIKRSEFERWLNSEDHRNKKTSA